MLAKYLLKSTEPIAFEQIFVAKKKHIAQKLKRCIFSLKRLDNLRSKTKLIIVSVWNHTSVQINKPFGKILNLKNFW